MASNRAWLLLAGIVLAGCGGPENDPEMGAVPPKPNPQMNVQLPPEVQRQLAQAKPGSDAAAMAGRRNGGR